MQAWLFRCINCKLSLYTKKNKLKTKRRLEIVYTIYEMIVWYKNASIVIKDTSELR